MVQRNDGSGGFHRPWSDYKYGFGDSSSPTGAYWVGNDFLYSLTHVRLCMLHFDLQDSNGNWYWAEYSKFSVDNEDTLYTVHISGYSGTAGDATIPGPDGGTDGMKFSTYDHDNFMECAWKCRGGFWYDSCSYIMVNTPAQPNYWMAWSIYNNPSLSMTLRFSRMYLMCI